MSCIRKPFFYFLLFLSVFACNNENKNSRSLTDKDHLPTEVLEGKNLFEASCVRCHGMDATGLTGPSLIRPKLKHATDLPSFTKVVEQGIVGTGMPGNWVFADEDCSQLYAYINYLKNKGTEVPKGDTAAGRIIYMKQACMTCHLMNGHGTGIGPDLSEIGASRNAAYLRQAILDPGASLPESTDIDNGYGFSLYLPLKIRTRDGKEIAGLRINEDTYTIQLKDAANNYYSFNKDQLLSIDKLYGQSLMPSYKSNLSDTELENLVAFLYKSGNQ